jgi:hypothetical protein
MHSGEIEISQLHRFCAPQLGPWIKHHLSAAQYAIPDLRIRLSCIRPRADGYDPVARGAKEV